MMERLCVQMFNVQKLISSPASAYVLFQFVFCFAKLLFSAFIFSLLSLNLYYACFTACLICFISSYDIF